MDSQSVAQWRMQAHTFFSAARRNLLWKICNQLMQTYSYMCYVPISGPGAWLKLPASKVRDGGFEPDSGIQISKKQKFLPRSLVKIQYCGEAPWPRGSVLGFLPPGSCVWSTVSSHSSHHPREVILVKFSLYVHKCGLETRSFHLSEMVKFKTEDQSWPPRKQNKFVNTLAGMWATPLLQVTPATST